MKKITRIFLALFLVAALSLVAQEAEQSSVMTEQDLALAEALFENDGKTAAFEIFAEMAQQGNMEAMAWQGRCYMNGVGTAVDFDKAFACFSQAAQSNNAWALNGLGICYEYGRGVAKDLQKAIGYFQQAAQMGLPLAALNLAKTYADQNGGFYNAEKADEVFRTAIDLEAPNAILAYGLFLYDEGKFNEALPLLETFRFNPSAMQPLIDCYENGLGGPVNIPAALEVAERYGALGAEEAQIAGEVFFNAAVEEVLLNGVASEKYASLYHKAADFGYHEAILTYAQYLEQKGDLETALGYLTRDVTQLNAPEKLYAARLALALEHRTQALKLLLDATEDPSSEQEAVPMIADIYRFWGMSACRHWEQRGCEMCDAHCRNQVAWDEIQTGIPQQIAHGFMLLQESVFDDDSVAKDLTDKNFGQYYECLLKLADQGDPDAMAALGMYGYNQGPDHPNRAIGLELLEQAAEKQSPNACRFLGYLYFKGLLGEQDLDKAVEWYEKGAVLGDLYCARGVPVILFYFADQLPEEIPLDTYKRCFDRCRDLGDVRLAYEYGVVLEYLGNDLEGARKQYGLAAADGDVRGMLRLHDLLFESAPEVAISHLQDAVRRGDEQAFLAWGDFQKLECANFRRAFVAYAQSYLANPENTASYQLALSLLLGIGCSKNTEIGISAAKLAYENGVPGSCSLLGDIYHEGKIVPRDEAKAQAYYEEGVRRGDPGSRKALGLPEEAE